MSETQIEEWMKDPLPEEFKYWEKPLKDYGRPRPVPQNRPHSFTESQIEDLRAIYRELSSRSDLSKFWHWLSQRQRSPFLRTRVVSLFGRFKELARHGIEPFASGDLEYESPQPVIDWSKIPDTLSYIKPVAIKYGGIQFDNHIAEFLATGTPEQFQELRDVLAQIEKNNGWPIIKEWLKHHRMPDHPEAAAVYFSLGLAQEVADMNR